MTTAYSHTPRPIGGAISFELREDRLTVDVGRKAVEIPLASVEEVRMTYEPRNLAQKAFRTRLRLKGGRSFSFTSVDWKSRIDSRSQDGTTAPSRATLLDAVARADPQARFVAGRPRRSGSRRRRSPSASSPRWRSRLAGTEGGRAGRRRDGGRLCAARGSGSSSRWCA